MSFSKGPHHSSFTFPRKTEKQPRQKGSFCEGDQQDMLQTMILRFHGQWIGTSYDGIGRIPWHPSSLFTSAAFQIFLVKEGKMSEMRHKSPVEIRSQRSVKTTFDCVYSFKRTFEHR